MCLKMTDNCRETKKVARFKGTLVFTDAGDRQVKWYNPSTKKVETLAADGSEGAQLWDWKKLQLRSSARHLQCFKYTFHNGCC